MPGFEKPNTTPTPNELFDKYLADLGNAELRVLLAIIRYTYGYVDDTTPSGRRVRVTLSMQSIRKITGLSENGVKAGVQAALNRGLVRRINHPNSHRTSAAKWELVFKSPPSASEGGKPPPPSATDGELPQPVRDLKERKKESSSSSTGDTEPILIFYKQEFGKVTPTIREKLITAKETYSEEWVLEALTEAVTYNKPSWAYADAILRRWKKEGKIKNVKPDYTKDKGVHHANRQTKPSTTKRTPTEPTAADLEAARRAMAKRQARANV